MSLRTEHVTKTVEAFKLKLPEEFAISPLWLVPLSATRTAEIYPIISKVLDYDNNNGDKYKSAPGWRVVIKTTRGTFLDTGRYEKPEGIAFTDPLLLSLYLQKLAVDFAKKKTTTIEESEVD